jgi:hypothetical protein
LRKALILLGLAGMRTLLIVLLGLAACSDARVPRSSELESLAAREPSEVEPAYVAAACSPGSCGPDQRCLQVTGGVVGPDRFYCVAVPPACAATPLCSCITAHENIDVCPKCVDDPTTDTQGTNVSFAADLLCVGQ